MIDPLPENQAVFIPASSRIAARTHFSPTRQPVAEKLQLGIYYANGTVEYVEKMHAVLIKDLAIPPGAPSHTRRRKKAFKEAANVTHFRVHMHLRGKSSKIIFHYPDGKSQTVFDLPRYSFRWQRYYYLAEPLKVAKGTVAEFVGVWDNSPQNPDNPDPTVWCTWGRRTVDEMFGSVAFYTPQTGLDRPLKVVNGRLAD